MQLLKSPYLAGYKSNIFKWGFEEDGSSNNRYNYSLKCECERERVCVSLDFPLSAIISNPFNFTTQAVPWACVYMHIAWTNLESSKGRGPNSNPLKFPRFASPG